MLHVVIDPTGLSSSFHHEELLLRIEYEKLETKYLMVKEKNEELQNELQLMKETQGGFWNRTRSRIGG